jgi:hypothetical protein
MNPDNKGPRKWKSMSKAEFEQYIKDLVDGMPVMYRHVDGMTMEEYQRMLEQHAWTYKEQPVDPMTGEPGERKLLPATAPKPEPKYHTIITRTPLAPVQIGGPCTHCRGGLAMVRYDAVAGPGGDFFCDDCDRQVLESLTERDDVNLIEVDYTTEVV